MFKLFKATAIVSIATMTTILVGVVRAKFTAVTLGPSGVGIFSQAFNFQQLAITVSSLSMGLGIAKYVAEYHSRKEDENVKGTIVCAFTLQLLVSLLSILAIALFPRLFSRMLFSSGEYGGLIFIVSIGTLFFVMAGTIEAIMFGFGSYKVFAKGRGFSGLLSLLPLFVFVYTMGTKGAFLYLAASGVITFLVYIYLFRKYIPGEALSGLFKKGMITRIKSDISRLGRNLLTYGGVSFVTGILSLANVILLRSMLIRYFGPEANGYYQVVFSLSAYYIAFFTNGLWAYFFAKISSVQDTKGYCDEMNGAIRFCVFGMVPAIVGLFLLRDSVIHLIFSKEFLMAKALFPGQLLGDLFFIIFYIMGTSLLGRARLKIYLLFNILYTVSFITAFFLFKDLAGIAAITTAYCLTNIFLTLAIVYYHISRMELTIYPHNIRLFVSGAVLCSAILWIDTSIAVSIFIKGGLLAAWLIFMSSKAERGKMFGLVVNKLGIVYGGKNG